ncbi:hypothetical protein [Actinacidiphila rubida]|uniref:ATP-binding protein n=1 Tax=Actinacidiphila rubida TaxID=310780 RepID=A0A1H8U8V8_9ACTN|nr:hypothetical protein [Actinacidiphila rubida]SEO99712.1 hypothetical protein SAMN05216267_10672 [Actinacidiphila rubida]
MASLRTALVLTLTGAAAVAIPAGTAAAAAPADATGPQLGQALPDTLTNSALGSMLPTQSVTGALASGIGPVKNLTLDPLSHTGTDPLDNALGSQIADFKPVSTAVVTDPVTHGGSLATLPLVGKAAGLLPG